MFYVVNHIAQLRDTHLAPNILDNSLASSVLPQPGGPDKRMPRTCPTPNRLAARGFARDAKTRLAISVRVKGNE